MVWSIYISEINQGKLCIPYFYSEYWVLDCRRSVFAGTRMRGFLLGILLSGKIPSFKRQQRVSHDTT